jgi:hypothetical protein
LWMVRRAHMMSSMKNNENYSYMCMMHASYFDILIEILYLSSVMFQVILSSLAASKTYRFTDLSCWVEHRKSYLVFIFYHWTYFSHISYKLPHGICLLALICYWRGTAEPWGINFLNNQPCIYFLGNESSIQLLIMCFDVPRWN